MSENYNRQNYGSNCSQCGRWHMWTQEHADQYDESMRHWWLRQMYEHRVAGAFIFLLEPGFAFYYWLKKKLLGRD